MTTEIDSDSSDDDFAKAFQPLILIQICPL